MWPSTYIYICKNIEYEIKKIFGGNEHLKVQKHVFLLFSSNYGLVKCFSNRGEQISMDHCKEIGILVYKHILFPYTFDKR